MYEIRPETLEDEYEVELLYDLCFAPGRTALSSYRLRENVAKVAGLCLVLRDDSRNLQAAIRYWPVRVGDCPVLLLGPIAVHPTAQGEGLGAMLIWDSLARARDTEWMRVLLVGDAPYYARFGFVKLDEVEMPPPTNPDRVLGLELREGAWAGVTGPVTRDLTYLVDEDLAKPPDRPHIDGECNEDKHLEGAVNDDQPTAGIATNQ